MGVDVAYDNVTEIKQLVDEISPYANLIIIGSQGITFDVAKLNDVCSYIYDKGMDFMIYMHPEYTSERIDVQRQWLTEAKTRWGQSFLGLYAFDEPGGRQLDNDNYTALKDWSADNFTDAANQYTTRMNMILQYAIEYNFGDDWRLATSDYALYWFDYKAGYDVVFAEFGWNYSRQLNVALARGAANVQGKDWGVMITWTYTQPPYLESATALYNDLVLAYENGAKYILIFDTNENYTHTTLQPEHRNALKRFWQYAVDNPRPSASPTDRVAYVLPDGYAYGFRGPDDKIWGLWQADDFSFAISTEVGGLIKKYQNSLDIIYDDGLEANETYGYNQMIFWNGTSYVP
ncbi:MAG: hypothetical protein NWE99_04005 [Candidatus Bathyarchaeota archaeon]|nr:hypothetical protein [Candidatus Bathyarchaeota archaeon]